MNAESYRVELLKILRTHSEQAVDSLKAMDAALSKNVRGIEVGIHPNQDSDGMFSIIIHLDGPDLFVLNKAIQGHRTLFDVHYVDGQLVPQVPMFDPFDLEFEVNDVIVDTSIIWLEEIWNAFGGTASNLPVIVFGEDGYGTKAPKQLSP